MDNNNMNVSHLNTNAAGEEFSSGGFKGTGQSMMSMNDISSRNPGALMAHSSLMVRHNILMMI